MLPGIQTSIVEKLTTRLSKDLNTEISIGRVKALPFAGITLNNFLVRDLKNDTLLFAPEVHSEIDYFSILKKHFYIGKITFSSPTVKLKEYKDGMNFTFLVDSIGKDNAGTSQWHYSVRGIDIENGNLTFSNSILKNPSFQRDSLLFSNLNISITRTSGINDSLDFRIEQLNLKEQSGLTIKSAGADGQIREDRITLNNFFLRTDDSSINIDKLTFPVNPGKKQPTAPENRFRALIKQIRISSRELGLFLRNVPKLEKPIGLSGEIYGSLKNIKGHNILVSAGRHTRLRTSFDLTDLTDFEETFIFMNVETLQTTADDLSLLLSPPGKKNNPIYAGLEKLGMIHYSGNFTGFINDLVAYGKFETELGTISTDIGMKYSKDRGISFSGDLHTKGFQIGQAFSSEKNIGSLTIDTEINGSWKDKTNYFAYLSGDIKKFEWKQYAYHDIKIKGLLTYQRFDGSVHVHDPNGILRFDGEIDASGETPVFQFRADVENIQPDRLNIIPKMKDGVITMSVGANFRGDNIDNLSGKIKIYDGLIYTPKTSLSIDSLSLKAFEEGNEKKIRLNSDFIEGEITGQYNLKKFRHSFNNMIAHFLPSLVQQEEDTQVPLNRFNFDFSFKGFDRALDLLYPGLKMAHDGHIKGEVNSEKQILDVEANFQNISYRKVSADNVDFHVSTRNGSDLQIVTRAGKISNNDAVTLYNLSVHNKAGRDTLSMDIFWNNWSDVTNSGAIYTSTAFSHEKNNKFYFSTHLFPSKVILNDSIWNISEAMVLFTPQSFSILGLEVEHDFQKLGLNGFLHKTSADGMKLEMDNIDISQFLGNNNQSDYHFGGIVNGAVELKNYYRTALWAANLSVDQFSFNGDTTGLFTVTSQWAPEKKALAINTSIQKNDQTPLKGSGYLYPTKNNIDLSLDLNRFSLSFLDTFIGNILQDFNGSASGKLFLNGDLSAPYLTGKVMVDTALFNVDLLQTSYEIEDSVWFYPHEIRFKDLTVKDRNGKEGTFHGSIYHEGFANMVYNLHLDAKEMLVLDTRYKDNPYYYGTVYADGNLKVSGTSQNIELTIGGKTLKNTRFFIPMADTEEAVQSNFIRFISNKSDTDDGTDEKDAEPEYKVDLSGLELNMEIEVTPEAKIEIIFDSTVGDLLSATGNGNIQIQINRQGNINFFGEYVIDEGEYLFSLQNLVNKKFAINSGGTVTWQGDPSKARIDLTAVYKVKASLADLVGPMADINTTGDQTDIQRRTPINCNLMLNGPLEKPGIKFGIEAPTLSEGRESYILDFISSEDEMNRQVLSLLVLNRFYTPEYLRTGNDQGSQTNNAALVTTTEMLSNQLSRWLSTISKDVDVGVSYRPEDDISSEEIEVALSTQMFNNRVTINGNVGYGKYQTNTSKMVGDFDMDVKLNNSGTIRAKAYTHSNDDIIYETSPTTQGIGLSFKEEFDKFTDLLLKYWRAITGKKTMSNE
jgi:hypothetical protein